MTRGGARLLHVLGLGLALGAQSAYAQDPERPPVAIDPGTTAPPPPDVEAIEVTGERLDTTDVQDEAQAITAFNQQDLDRAGILSVDNLGANVPGLHVGQQGNQAIITLRGIGTQNASVAGEPGVQFHVDGVNYARPSAARVAFFDLESVLVHRGPYGIRGGKNASGGAIEVVTRKPTDEFGIEADYQVGSYDQSRARGAINIPLIPEYAKARFAFITESRTGYQKNLTTGNKSDRADDADTFGWRGHLSLTPTESFEALLSGNYYQSRGVGPGLKLVTQRHYVPCYPVQPAGTGTRRYQRVNYFTYPTGTDFQYPAGAIPQGPIVTDPRITRGEVWVPIWLAREGFTRHSDAVYCIDINAPDKVHTRPSEDPEDPREVYLDHIQQQDNRIWGYAATLKWDVPGLPLLGDTELLSISGFEDTSLSDPRDFDTTDAPILVIDPITNESYQYSSELRLSSAGGDPLEWSTGLFYMRERSDAFQLGTLYASEEGFRTDQYNIVKSYGAYADFNLQLSDAWSLGLGTRYSWDDKETRLDRRNGGQFSQAAGQIETIRFCISAKQADQLAGSLGVPLDQVPPPVCTQKSDWWTGHGSLEWRPRDGQLLYLKFDTGYKAGGFIIGDSGRFDPERNRATTLGAKSEFLDGRLQLNVEAFHYLYRDYQVVNIDGTALRTETAPKVRVRGVDVEATAQPLTGLKLDAKVSYLDARFREFCSVDPLEPGRAFQVREGQAVCTGQDLNNNAVPDPGESGLYPDDVRDGNDLPRSPRLTYTLMGEYEVPIGRWGSLVPHVQYMWSDEAFYRVYNTEIDFQDRYHKTDLRLIWVSPEETWTAEAFVENLENDDVFLNMVLGSNAVGTPPLAQYAAPRLWGFRIGFKY
jgi:iron complex outermembrane receptor protein